MAKDKHKKHHEWCKAYKMRGQREINKAIKQERHKKRMERFAKRKEEGKSYVYQPNPYVKGTFAYEMEAERRARKNNGKLCEFQRWRRYFGRMHRDTRAIYEAERQEQIRNRKLHTKGKGLKQEDPEVTVN